MSTRIQIRRDTHANWTSVNPILADGEITYDKDNKKIKVGNGIDYWTDLPYLDEVDLSPYALDADLDTEKNRNDTQDGQIAANNTAITNNTNAIADLYIGIAKFTVTGSITNETLSTVSNLKQNGRNNLIANGVNAINITLTATADAKFQAIYHKLGSANITFVAGSGVTLVLIDSTAVMTGAAGFQTAAVHRDGSIYYIQISNR